MFRGFPRGFPGVSLGFPWGFPGVSRGVPGEDPGFAVGTPLPHHGGAYMETGVFRVFRRTGRMLPEVPRGIQWKLPGDTRETLGDAPGMSCKCPGNALGDTWECPGVSWEKQKK
jgi:hypothetical protein